MNIGLFTDTFLPQINGVVVSICNVNDILVKRGYKIKVFTVGGRFKIENVSGYEVHMFRGVTFRPYPEYMILLPKYSVWKDMQKSELDIIHSRSPFSLGVIGKRLSQVKHIPLIGTFDTPISDYVHYIPFFGSVWPTKDILNKFAKKYTKIYYDSCDLITTPSNTTKQWLLDLGFENKIEVVSNGVDMEKFSPKKRNESLKSSICSDNEIMILHVGRITKEKRVDRLVNIATILKKNGMKFKMVVIGMGPYLTTLKRLASEKGLKEIVFLGYVGQEDLPKYYASADVFLTASPVETQGIVLLESLSSGLPVVGVNAGAIPELVKGGNGSLFDTDCEAAEKVAETSSNMSKACRTSVSAHSLENVSSKIEKLYRKVTNL